MAKAKNEKKIGRVIHYYDQIGVAIVALSDALQVGDKVRFERGGEDLFEQKVASMEADHKSLKKGKKGDEVGLKVIEPAKEGADVYKLTD